MMASTCFIHIHSRLREKYVNTEQEGKGMVQSNSSLADFCLLLKKKKKRPELELFLLNVYQDYYL